MADYGGFEYDSDYYGDDLPFWMKVQKTDGAVVPHLIVPYTLDWDMRCGSCIAFAFRIARGNARREPSKMLQCTRKWLDGDGGRP